MLVSGLDHIINAFEAGWESYESWQAVGAREEAMSGALAEFWHDGHHFARRTFESTERTPERVLMYRRGRY